MQRLQLAKFLIHMIIIIMPFKLRSLFVTERSGYIECLVYNESTGNSFVYVYYWNINAKAEDSIYRGSCKLELYDTYINVDMAYGEFYDVILLSSDGRAQPNFMKSDNSGLMKHSFPSGFKLVSYNAYGSYYSVTNNLTGSAYAYKFIVLYQDEIVWDAWLENISRILNWYGQYTESIYLIMDGYLKTTLNAIKERLGSILNSFNSSTSSDEDNAANKVEEDSNNRKEELDELNKENQTDKVDIDDASDLVDEYLDPNASGDNSGDVIPEEEKVDFTQTINVVLAQPQILEMLMIVLSTALVSYVLFGKK